MTIAAVPVHSRSRLGTGDHAAGRHGPGGRLSGETEDRAGTATTSAPIPPGSTPTALHSRGRDCLANMGIYLFNRQTLVDVLREDRLPRLRQGGLSGVDPLAARAGPSVRRLLGRHRHDQVVLRGEPGPGGQPTRRSIWRRRGADLLARPISAADAHRRRHDPRQPGGRRLADRRRRGDREQRHRPALPDRPQRGDPQFDPDGQRLLRTPDDIALHKSNGQPPLGVGEGTHIEGAIIDKNCRIGRNVRIVNEQGLEDTEETPFGMIRDGIVVIPKGTTLPDHWSQE